jgi:hypothetical protein
VRVPSRTGRAGVVTFHSQTFLSWLPAASVRPSGLNATESTCWAGPVSGLPSATGWAGSDTFHSRTVLSALPAASRVPSGLNATDCT